MPPVQTVSIYVLLNVGYVNRPISVTALGNFYGDNIENLFFGATVAIFDLTTKTQVGPAVTITNVNYTSLVNDDAFISLATPIALAVGDYSIVSFALPENDFNSGGAANPYSVDSSDGGAISFVGSGRYDASSSLDLPNGVDGGPANRYDAGTFEFTSAPVPTPGAFWGGLGLMGGLLVARKLRQSGAKPFSMRVRMEA
jgi:hypothetical protein